MHRKYPHLASRDLALRSISTTEFLHDFLIDFSPVATKLEEDDGDANEKRSGRGGPESNKQQLPELEEISPFQPPLNYEAVPSNDSAECGGSMLGPRAPFTRQVSEVSK